MSAHDWAPEKRSFGDRLRDLWHEGMVRHVIVAKDERRIVDLPLAIIVIATLLAPWLTAIGAAIALLTEHHIGMERREDRHVPPSAPAPSHPEAAPTGAGPAGEAPVPEALTGEASQDLPAPPPPPIPPGASA